MFWIGLIALVIFLVTGDPMNLGAVILWVGVYTFIALIIDILRWSRKR